MAQKNSLGRKYPVKTDMNLAMKETRKRELKSAVPAFLFLALFIAAFAKFAVIDRLAAASEAENRAGAAKIQLEQVKQANLGYNQVLEEYDNYHLGQSLSQGKTSPMDILGLMDQILLPAAAVESFSVSNGVITVKTTGASLNRISQIFRELSSDPLVYHVKFYTASSNEEGSQAKDSAVFTITLSAEEKARQEAQKAKEGQGAAGKDGDVEIKASKGGKG